MKKCSQVYLKNSQDGQWAVDNVSHKFSGLFCDGDFTIHFCSNCGGKKMKGVTYIEEELFEDNGAW